MEIKGLGAIVSGGASGLGAATARHLAGNGARVAVALDAHDGPYPAFGDAETPSRIGDMAGMGMARGRSLRRRVLRQRGDGRSARREQQQDTDGEKAVVAAVPGKGTVEGCGCSDLVRHDCLVKIGFYELGFESSAGLNDQARLGVETLPVTERVDRHPVIAD